MDPAVADYQRSLDDIDGRKHKILNLTTIAWESKTYAAQIRDLINRKIVTEGDPKKIKALIYLIDAIIKNPPVDGDKTFINVFAQNVASIFADAYRKVVHSPNEVAALNNVKKTWINFFPRNVLDNLERNVKSELDQGRQAVPIYGGSSGVDSSTKGAPAQPPVHAGRPANVSPQPYFHGAARGNGGPPPPFGSNIPSQQPTNQYPPQHRGPPQRYGYPPPHQQQKGGTGPTEEQQAVTSVKNLLREARGRPDAQAVQAFSLILDLIDQYKQRGTLRPDLAVQLRSEVNAALLDRMNQIRNQQPPVRNQQPPAQYNRGGSGGRAPFGGSFNSYSGPGAPRAADSSFEQAVRTLPIPDELADECVIVDNEADMNRFRKSFATGLYEAMRKQCPTCGLRFAESDSEAYTKHLDWHYEQNRLKGVMKLTSRRWFPKPENWISPGSVVQKDDRPAAEEPEAQEEEVPAEHCWIQTDGNEDGVCTVTGEPLTRMFEPDVGRWYYEDAVRIDGKLVKSSVANKESAKRSNDGGASASTKRSKH